MICFSSLYPRHLCRGVYSFRLFARPFICSLVCTSVPFVELLQSFTCNQKNDLCVQRRLCTQWVAKSARFFMRTAKLIRLGKCPGWSASSFCAEVILLVLSCNCSHIEWSSESMMCFSSFYHKIMFSAVKNAKAVLISYFHSYNSFSYAEKEKIMPYVHQLLDQPSQWQTSQQAGPGSVPKFTSTSITVKQLLIKNINQSKSSLLIWHYVSYLFLFIFVDVNTKQENMPLNTRSIKIILF